MEGDRPKPRDVPGGEAGGRIPEVSFRLELDGRAPAPGGDRVAISPSGSPVSGPPSMQKCLSFPRIVTDRPSSWSISPCQSRTYLDACYPASFLGGSEKSMDPDRLSIAGHAGLLRSMSARTVEVECRPEPDHSINSSGSSSRYLSPACDRADALAGRSTSCPSMAYADTSSRPRDSSSALPPGTTADMRHLLFRRGDREEGDIDLAGEEIDDLPIEPNAIFPELPSDLIESCSLADAAGLSLKELRIGDASDNRKNAPSTNKDGSTTSAARREAEKPAQAQQATSGGGTKEGAYVNVRDLPRSTMSEAMKGRHMGLSTGQNMDTNQKCLRWLNTLPAQRS